jgi:hypothetical protein
VLRPPQHSAGTACYPKKAFSSVQRWKSEAKHKGRKPMTRWMSAALAAGLVLGLGRLALADGQDAKAVIDKAVKALGGPEKLGAAKAVRWKTKGKISRNDEESDFSTKVTAEGIDKVRQEFEGEFGGNPVKGVTVIDGDKGWRKFGEETNALEGDRLANQKRSAYLQLVPEMPSLLKGEGFKVEAGEEEKVGGKPAAVLKVTGPDGKDFQLFFDKESGLPVKLTATVMGRGGNEFAQVTTFANYKDFDGIKRATKIETKRDGKKFMESEVTEFKVLDKVDPKTFAEPKAD